MSLAMRLNKGSYLLGIKLQKGGYLLGIKLQKGSYLIGMKLYMGHSSSLYEVPQKTFNFSLV